MGRPRKKIDPQLVAKLAKKHWKIAAIAAHFGVSRDTIERRFAAIIEENRHLGAAIPVDLAWEAATIKKDWRAIEWLLKNVSGFKDNKVIVKHEGQAPLPAPNANSDQLQRLETLLNEIKAPQNEDREAKMLAIAKRLGIEK